MIINSLSFCLGKSLSLIHIWRTVLLVIIFLVVSFFQHFENTTLLPSGLWGSCWELYWYRVEESFPICDEQLFSCYFLIFLYDFYNLIVTVSVWIYLGSSFFAIHWDLWIWMSISFCRFGRFWTLFLWNNFPVLSFLSFWDFCNRYIVLLGEVVYLFPYALFTLFHYFFLITPVTGSF